MKSISVLYIVGSVVVVMGIACAFALKTKDGFRGGGGGGDGGGARIGGGMSGGMGGIGSGDRVGGMTGYPGESLHRGYYTGYLPNLSSSAFCKTDSDCGESRVCRNGSCTNA